MNADSLLRFLSSAVGPGLETRFAQLLGSAELIQFAGLLRGQLSAVPGALADISKGLWNLLDIRVSEVLVKVWNESGVLKKYLDPDEYKPEDTVLVELAEHEIQSEHHPSLEILINGQKELEIVIDVKLELSVSGMILKIQDAKIKELKTGWCKAKGAVSCKGLKLLERDTGEIELPGSIEFGEGIPIAP
jgi:hypothetical protein